MKKNKLNKGSLSWSLFFIIFINSHVSAENFYGTGGYKSFLNHANQLKGISYIQEAYRFAPYCEQYAKIAVAQATRRIEEGCTFVIPLYNNDISSQWRLTKAPQKSWCKTVPAYVTSKNTINRETELKSCINKKAKRDKEKDQSQPPKSGHYTINTKIGLSYADQRLLFHPIFETVLESCSNYSREDIEYLKIEKVVSAGRYYYLYFSAALFSSDSYKQYNLHLMMNVRKDGEKYQNGIYNINSKSFWRGFGSCKKFRLP